MALSKEFNKLFGFLPMISRQPDRKSWFRILQELIHLTFYNRSLPTFYFSRHLYRKDRQNIKDFIPNKVLYGISEKMNDQEAASVLSNKLFFDLYYRPHIKALPRIIMFNHGNSFIAGAKQIKVSSIDKFEELLEMVVKNETNEDSVFIKKTYASHGGKNIFKIYKASFPLERDLLSEMYKSIINSAYIFQETVAQHDEINLINPYCVNTIRIDTIIDQEGNCNIGTAYLRLGLNKLPVDNLSSGGVSIGIDLESGTLQSYGFTSITQAGGSTLSEHPTTGTVFQDFKIPYFDEVKQLVIQAAKLTPSLRMVGWDVAISPKGPILIEGNNRYNLTAHDRHYGGYKGNPAFRRVMMELNIK